MRRLASNNSSEAKKVMERFNKNATEIGAMLLDNKSYCSIRLVEDLKEIKKQKVPVIGVSAFPIEEDLRTWHANIKNNCDNIYKGCIFHLELKFPSTYPLSPPKIRVLNEFEKFGHTSIMEDGHICLDMLNQPNGNPYGGWTCAYTVLSILIQLQNFYFDFDFTRLSEEQKKEAPEYIRRINDFTCGCCGHKGSSNPFPEFPTNPDMQHFITPKSCLRDIMKSELNCAVKKTSYDKNPLGFGVNITKARRTGEIKDLTLIQEYLSLKAFVKIGVRTIGFSKSTFSKWLPIYFGINKDQFLHLSKNALSMIYHGTTKKFTPDLILKIYPKILVTLIKDLVTEKEYISSKSLKTMIHIYRNFRLLVDSFPELQNEIDSVLLKFINEPAHRIKDNTSSLGDLLGYALMSEKVKFKDFLIPYMSESLDRSIFWMIQAVPELENVFQKNGTLDEIKLKACFKAGNSGFLQVFNYFLNKVIRKDFTPTKEFTDQLDKDLGLILDEEVYNHVKRIKEIMKIDNFIDLYVHLELPKINESEMGLKLKQAVNNSLAKKYHGDIDEHRAVPDNTDQLQLLLSKFASTESFVDKEGKLLPSEDSVWKKICLENLEISKSMKYSHFSIELTPEIILKEYNSTLLDSINFVLNEDFDREARIYELINPNFKSQHNMANIENEYLLKNLDWRRLYIKIFFEFYVRHFRYITDFKELYNYIELFSQHINHFTFVISSEGLLKSDFNYVRSILAKLKSVKCLKFIFEREISQKLLKNILKGYSLFLKEGGDIEYLSILTNNKYPQFSNQEINLLTILDKMPTLKHLNLTGTNLKEISVLRIRNHLYYFKTLQSICLSKTSLTDNMAKELADGIMKAKCLEFVDLSHNPLKTGLSSIIYNLAFQPMLKHLSINDSPNVDAKELASSIYKLIKMSTSLETLNCRNINKLNGEFTKDFFISLGDNSYLKSLNISKSGLFTKSSLENLGTALAFNALKGGVLKELYAASIVTSYDHFQVFIESHYVSEETHVSWYNSPYKSELTKDKKEYFIKHFYCNLRLLDFSGSSLNSHIYINDPKNKEENHIRKYLENTPSLVTLIINESNLNKCTVELIANALLFKNSLKTLAVRKCGFNGEFIKILFSSFGTSEDIKPNCNLESIDLSSNSFGYSGINTISTVLKFNKTLRILNLFHNIFDVNGARRLAEALEINSTLEAIDIGYNRIKDHGMGVILTSLRKNLNIPLKFLGIKYNFLNLSTISASIDYALNSKLTEIEAANNISEEESEKIMSQLLLKETKRSVFIDLLGPIFNNLPEKLERTVWISPVEYNCNKDDIYKAITKAEYESIEDNGYRIGIPYKIVVRKGRKTGFKKDNKCSVAFVEFIHPNSANMMLKIASKGFFVGASKEERTRVFKAGSKPEYIVFKKKINDDVPNINSRRNAEARRRERVAAFRARGRGRGGFRGRGIPERGGRGRVLERGGRGRGRGK